VRYEIEDILEVGSDLAFEDIGKILKKINPLPHIVIENIEDTEEIKRLTGENCRILLSRGSAEGANLRNIVHF